jgi:hypothetical protein
MKLRAPRSQREVIRMLALYEEQTGLDGLLARFDFSAIAPWMLDRIVLGQPNREPRPPADTDPAEHVKALLLSNPFRQFALRNLLDAFPEKPRVLFVHVPKCAGTDLTASLQERYFSIDGAVENPGWFTPERRLAYLRGVVLAAEFVDTLFVRGHVPLRYYVNQALIRPGDQVFTVLRDPVDVVISMVNYVLTRLRDDPAGRTPDTRQWLAQLGMQQMPANLTQADWIGFAGRVMREKRVVTDNILCNALGRGDAASALEFMVASDIEITDISRYESWLAQRWGIPESRRANESVKFISRSSLGTEDMGFIESKVTEDRVLYDAVRRRLDATHAVSVRGRVLA